MTAVLSDRGRRLVERPPLAEYIATHFERSAAPYDPQRAPDGYIALCIAENTRMSEVLAERLARARPVPPAGLGYDAMVGTLPFREQLARFMGRALFGRSVAPDRLAVLAGAGAVLEILFYVLCDPGDGVLVPTPSYAGFWADLETRDGLTIVPVHRRADDGYALTVEALDRAVAGAGRPIKALLYTNPDNPLGRVAEAREIEAIVQWADRTKIQVVFDEVYALSVFGARPLVSVASLGPALGERVHVVWAFSKDFGASGLRCGVLYSENASVLQAVDALAYWSSCSRQTQHALGELVDDMPWVDAYVTEMRRRLGAAYDRVTTLLGDAGIAYVPADGGIFVMCDLRRFLSEATWDAEARLWRRLLDEANVNLTPGAACRAPEPGFFRLCYASAPPSTVEVGIRRIVAALHP